MGATDAGSLSPAAPISVIIPVCNGGTAFVHCLRALLNGDNQPEEIIVVANGCRDRSAEAARLAGATVIELPQPVGPAAARNAAARRARGDILFFVDADVAVHPDALGRIRARFSNHLEMVACFGSYDDAPPEKNFFSQYKNLFHHFMHQQARPRATTFWAGCGAIRRPVFEEMAGFNEIYRQPAVEDIELGYRLIAGGHQAYLDKGLLATHLKHWSLVSLLQSDIFNRALPWSRLILQTRVSVNDLNLRPRYRLSVLLAGLLCLLGLPTAAVGLSLWPSLAAVGLLLLLNMDWYLFLLRRKGPAWILPSVAWHWFYYLYSGCAYAWAAIERFFKKRQSLVESTQFDFDPAVALPTTVGDKPSDRVTRAERNCIETQLPLRILRIRVIDWALASNFASALEVDRASAKHVEHIDHIVYSPAGRNLGSRHVRPYFTIHPTRSRTKLHFFKDALRMANQLHQRQRYNLIHADDPMWGGLVGYLLKRRYHLPLLIKCHSDYYSSHAWRRESWRYYLDYLFSLWMIRRADWIKAVSRQLAEDLVGLGADPRCMSILPTPIRTGLFWPDRNSAAGDAPGDILFVGRLVKQKGLPALLCALEQLHQEGLRANLTVAGEGPRRVEIETSIQSLGLTKAVRLIGHRTHQQLLQAYHQHRFLVVPSLHEGFCKVIVEAGLCNRPTIGTRVGGIPELIVSGKTGLLVPPGNVPALAKAMTTLLQNPTLTRTMGRRAAESYRYRFAFPAILEKQLETFANAAGYAVSNQTDKQPV